MDISHSGLIARELTLIYEQRELFRALHISVERGETLAIIGRSGCGKSSILSILAGLIKPDAGEVWLDGKNITGKPGHSSLMPQESLLLPWRNLLDNAILALEIAGVDRGEARERARQWLPRFGLAGRELLYPHQASGGMQQRTALLRSCLHDSPVLLLDEPFGALDAITRHELQAWFAELIPGMQLAAVLVTHDIEEALALASRVIVFAADGQLSTHTVEATAHDDQRDALLAIL